MVDPGGASAGVEELPGASASVGVVEDVARKVAVEEDVSEEDVLVEIAVGVDSVEVLLIKE